MTNQTINLDLIPKGIPPIIYVSQYDKGQEWTFNILKDGEAFTIPTGSTVVIEGTKEDGTGFQDPCAFSGGVVTATETQQMTLFSGDVPTQLRITKNNDLIGSLNFIIRVEPATLGDSAIISDSELPLIIAIAEEQEENSEAWAVGTKDGVEVPATDPQYHNNAKYYAESIGAYGHDAEAWAIGERGGVPVSSGDETYHNNSKYYSQQASGSASSASTSETNAQTNALKAEGYAVGTQNGASAGSSSPYYHNNASYYSSQAKNDAINAHTDQQVASQAATRASASANSSDNSALKSEGYAIGTQNGTAVVSGPYYQNNAYYWAQRAESYVGAYGITDAEWALIEQVI